MAETQLVPFEINAALLAELMGVFPEQSNKDLTEGVQPSFAVVTFRGKVWRVRHKGEDRVVKMNNEPVQSIVAVICKASPAISKLYYAKAYAEGDDVPPDCYSLDGVVPDVTAVNKQSPTCASCRHNVWGSRITESGSKAKACADNRRLAIVPYPDLANESFGGPMLLRVPPTSLIELARLGDALKQYHLPYQAVVVKISFDWDVAYPKLVFTAVRPLTVAEAKVVHDHMESEAVLRMLVEPVQGDETNPEPAAATQRPTEAPQPAPAPEPTPEPKPAPEPAPAPAEPEQTVVAGNVVSFGDTTPEEKPAAKKPTPAKAAAAPAEVVNTDLSNMITDLLK
jgi:hypothetical protein